jgi:hypothetical protein
MLDLVKYYLIPHIVGKKTTEETHDALISLYTSVNISCRMHMRNKFFEIRMGDIESLVSYLMKIIELRY